MGLFQAIPCEFLIIRNNESSHSDILTFAEASPVPGTELSFPSHSLFDHVAFSLHTSYLPMYCQILLGLKVSSSVIILESSSWKLKIFAQVS